MLELKYLQGWFLCLQEIFSFFDFKILKTDTFEVRSDLPAPTEIRFVYDEKIKGEIQRSTDLFNRNANSLLCSELKLKNCNKEMIKSFKTNPDTFVQMCMQLAYYQLHKKYKKIEYLDFLLDFFNFVLSIKKTCSDL